MGTKVGTTTPLPVVYTWPATPLVFSILITQLKAMVTALRHELERNQSSYAENMQEVERCARDEVTQLQQTIRVLRQGLGERDARFATE